MNQDKLPLSEVTTQLAKDCPVFTLPPLTPEQIGQAREQADKVLERVFGQDSEDAEL